MVKETCWNGHSDPWVSHLLIAISVLVAMNRDVVQQITTTTSFNINLLEGSHYLDILPFLAGQVAEHEVGWQVLFSRRKERVIEREREEGRMLEWGERKKQKERKADNGREGEKSKRH